MAGTGPADLHVLAGDFLDACIDALDTIPTYAPGLAGAPERTFISPGRPVLDCCDQLAVHVEALTEMNATGSGQKARHGARTNLVTLIATSTRCIPTGTASAPPSPTELTDAAEQLDADAWALWNHVWNMIRADQLFMLCGEVFWDGLRALAPSGGCAGWVLQLRVQEEGYEEALGT
jgi:hypothetical protein